MMLRSTRYTPDWPTVLTASMLSLTVALIHVLDQGGITAYAGSPWWLGGGYWAVEIAGAATAVALMAFRRWTAPWVAAFAVGFGPLTAYLLTRLVGLPGDPGDVGNWSDPLGTASLFVEGTLILMAASMLHRFGSLERIGAPDSSTPAGRPPDGDVSIPISTSAETRARRLGQTAEVGA
jgi:hypothetical protein